MKRAFYALLAVQLAIIAALVVWRMGGDEAPPEGDNPVADLLAAIGRDGVDSALERLGKVVLQAGIEACHRDVCIARKFAGDKARWATVSAAGGYDPCAGAHTDACDRERTREALRVVLRAAYTRACGAGPPHKQGRRQVVTVRCGKLTDTVQIAPAAAGGALIVGARDFPGFLPNLFASAID